MTQSRSIFVFLIAIFATAVSNSAFGEVGSRPNVLLLVAEDMSARVGAFGDEVAVTPNIDDLASRGVRYPNSFTTAGVCAPSRAALILGMYQTSIGAHNMRTSSYKEASYVTVPPADVKAFPELLRRAGYYTFVSNKLDYQFSKVGAGSGPASIWDYEGDEPAWNRREPGQPFFGMYHFNDTHESRLFVNHPGRTAAASLAAPVTADQISVPPIYPDTPIVRETIAQLYNNIQRMDERVGALLRELEEDGLTENTVVIWTTDHGDGLPRFKREIFDTGIKVPMVISWPDSLLPAKYGMGDVDDQLVSFVDLAPTILSLAGVAIPTNIQGRSITDDGSSEERQYIFAAKDRLDEHDNRERAVRDNRYKYIVNYDPGTPGAQHIAYRDQLQIMDELWRLMDGGQLNTQQQAWFRPRPHEALYDTVNDPYETRNLAANPDYAATLERMQRALANWQESVPDLAETPEAELAQQFWPAGVQPVTEIPVITSGEDGKVTMSCPTDGASIIYRIDQSSPQIYTQPLRLADEASVSAVAVRYGWAESARSEFWDKSPKPEKLNHR